MATLKHRAEYLAALAGLWVANVLSPAAADRLGARLGRFAYRRMTSRREVAEENLRRALGDELSSAEITDITCRVFENIGRTLMEIARLKSLTHEQARRIIRIDDRTTAHEALNRGRGAIIVTPHFGNWEWMAACTRMEGYPINMLVTTQHNPLVDKMLTRLRERAGVGVVRVGRSARQILSLLKRNEFVAIAPDQHAPGVDIVMDFFGRPAAVPRGPALFAIRAGSPILPFAMRRDSYQSHVFMTGPAIYPPATGDKERDVEWMTRQYLDFFEDVIRRYPDQWMWTHRRWKLPEAGGNSA